jgi:hypothetical protein
MFNLTHIHTNWNGGGVRGYLLPNARHIELSQVMPTEIRLMLDRQTNLLVNKSIFYTHSILTSDSTVFSLIL